MRYEVFLPADGEDGFDVTLKLEAPNWMAALKQGLAKMGTGGADVRNVVCDIQSDNSIIVTDPRTRRIFRIRELGEKAAAEAPESTVPDLSTEASAARAAAEAARREAEEAARVAADHAALRIAQEQEQAREREEAERRAEEARRAKQEAAERARTEAARRAAEEAERRAREEKARREAERAAEEAERRAREEKARREAERAAEEAERRAREEKARREAERAAEEAERRAREEKARREAERAAEEAERARRAAEARARLEAEHRKAAEAQREAERTRRESGAQPEVKVLSESTTLHDRQLGERLRRAATQGEEAGDELLAEVFERMMDIELRAPDVDRAAEMALQIAVKCVDADSGAVLLADLNTNDLRFAATHGPKAQEVKKLRLRMGQGIAGFSAMEGLTLSVADVARDPRWYKQIAQKVGYETRSILCAAMLHEGRSYGCIELINRRGRPSFGAADAAALSYIATHLAEYLAPRVGRDAGL
jgi:hypothetical protein